MAKFGSPIGGMVGGGAPMASPRPMPRPAMGAAPQGGGVFGGGSGGLFANLDPQTRYDMTMGLLQQGMAAAQSSGSPLAAFLAPMAGAVIGGRAASRLDEAKASETDALTASMLGDLPPEAQRYADVLDNPNAPDYLKSIAKSRLEDALKPAAASGASKGGGRSSSHGSRPSGSGPRPRSTDALLASLMYDANDPSGDGGAEITPAEQARIDALIAARRRTSSATVTYESGGGPATVTTEDGYIIEQID